MSMGMQQSQGMEQLLENILERERRVVVLTDELKVLKEGLDLSSAESLPESINLLVVQEQHLADTYSEQRAVLEESLSGDKYRSFYPPVLLLLCATTSSIELGRLTGTEAPLAAAVP